MVQAENMPELMAGNTVVTVGRAIDHKNGIYAIRFQAVYALYISYVKDPDYRAVGV